MAELLRQDVTEYHKTLLKFKSVPNILNFKSTPLCKTSTMQTQERQLIDQSEDPHVLFVSLSDPHASHPDPSFEAMRTLVVRPSVSVRIPTPWEGKLYDVCSTSCDGLVCLYDFFRLPSIVVNPTTRWYRFFPRCNYQLFAAEEAERDDDSCVVPYPSPGFGKDKISGTYKPVWLYNSAQLGLNDEATTCEVFDFATNTWRYVVPASPHLVIHQDPVYIDGYLHWFTALSQEGETMVLSLDLHTETFQVIAKAPFVHVSNEFNIVMCNLDGRLCVSEEKCPSQVIWSLDGSSEHKTWKKIYSIDLFITSSFFPRHFKALAPLAVVDKDKLLFYDRESKVALVTHDPKTKSYEFAYKSKLSASAVCYFPSLVSIL
ncbi:hypothetical protein CARUB_v10015654mg [Capsella rubella]|uniref:F-box associated beta-propeller type 1 domain-containing protein n=1 Tax=Capsella rubella TaxID=81985 RepID=R0HJ08_9BRAS|nr:F-box protein At5g10340 [Capsella rubella]EOA29664.1 hypothetical protein CARUB_v10015654mg [Capsella rubella]